MRSGSRARPSGSTTPRTKTYRCLHRPKNSRPSTRLRTTSYSTSQAATTATSVVNVSGAGLRFNSRRFPTCWLRARSTSRVLNLSEPTSVQPKRRYSPSSLCRVVRTVAHSWPKRSETDPWRNAASLQFRRYKSRSEPLHAISPDLPPAPSNPMEVQVLSRMAGRKTSVGVRTCPGRLDACRSHFAATPSMRHRPHRTENPR